MDVAQFTRHIKRKKHALNNKVHLDYLDTLHENFVLVPADKAANNVIVVRKKYYMDVVINELSSTSTYAGVHVDCMDVVCRHIEYMMRNTIALHMQQEKLLAT